MNSTISISPAIALLVFFGSVAAADVPGFGAWGMTAVSGEATVIDETRQATRSWTFEVDPEGEGNLVRVLNQGELEFTITFGGVEGSPHPDGLGLGGTGRGEGGVIIGHSVRETGASTDDFHSHLETRIEGTYSETEMSASWTYNHIVRAGHITHTTMASGSFTAIYGAAR